MTKNYEETSGVLNAGMLVDKLWRTASPPSSVSIALPSKVE